MEKSITELLNEFNELKEELSEYFGTSINEGFDDMRYVESWKLSDGEINWNLNEEEYAGEIYGTSIWQKDEFILVRYDNGCGEKIYAVFDNSTRIL